MKRTTISDIAESLHVSLHTVNKALSGKKGVGEEMRAKIIQTASEMNYRVNRVAQSMARKPLLIGIINHSKFWPVVSSLFLQGIKDSIAKLQDYNVEGLYYTYSSAEERIGIFEEAIRDGVGVFVCLHFVPETAEVKLLQSKNIPFSILGTDGVENSRLTCVRADSIMAGRLTADIMKTALPESASVAVFTGDMNYRDHADKVNGFCDAVKDKNIKIIGVFEHDDDPARASELALKLCRKYPKTAGIYSSTGNSETLSKIIFENGLHPIIIATDLYGEVKALMRKNIISASVWQNAPGQGRKMVELLYSFICENEPVPHEFFIPPTAVFKANLDIF